MPARLNFGVSTNIGNVATPVEGTDAATKAYVDSTSGSEGVPVVSFTTLVGPNNVYTSPLLSKYEDVTFIEVSLDGTVLQNSPGVTYYTFSGTNLTLVPYTVAGRSLQVAPSISGSINQGTVTNVRSNVAGLTFFTPTTTPSLTAQNVTSPTTQFLRADGTWQTVLSNSPIVNVPNGYVVTANDAGKTLVIAGSITINANVLNVSDEIYIINNSGIIKRCNIGSGLTVKSNDLINYNFYPSARPIRRNSISRLKCVDTNVIMSSGGFEDYAWYPLRNSPASVVSTNWLTNNVTLNEHVVYDNVGIFYDGGKILDFSFMFYNATTFNDPDFSLWDLGEATNFSAMLSGCSSFNQSIPAIYKGIYFAEMMNGCTSFNQPFVLNTYYGVDFSYFFKNCTSFNQKIDWFTFYCVDFHQMFYGCTALTQSVRLLTSNCKDFSDMFNGCSSLVTPLDTSRVTSPDFIWNTKAAVNMSGMFTGCTVFNQNLDFFDTANCENFSNMFNGCRAFNGTIDFDTSSATNMSGMFQNCVSFNQNVGKFNTRYVELFTNMLSGATVFNSGQPSGVVHQLMQRSINDFWNTGDATDMTGMFQNCAAFAGELSTWCVTPIPTLPANFATGANANFTVARQPQWGTCIFYGRFNSRFSNSLIVNSTTYTVLFTQNVTDATRNINYDANGTFTCVRSGGVSISLTLNISSIDTTAVVTSYILKNGLYAFGVFTTTSGTTRAHNTSASFRLIYGDTFTIVITSTTTPYNLGVASGVFFSNIEISEYI